MDIVKLNTAEADLLIGELADNGIALNSPILQYFAESKDTENFVPEDVSAGLTAKGLYPVHEDLKRAFTVLFQPDMKISLFSRMYAMINPADFYVKDGTAVNFAFHDNGDVFIHPPVLMSEFIDNTVELFSSFLPVKSRDDELLLRYTFSIDEYLVISAVIQLEDAYLKVGSIDELGELSFSVEDIIECIRNRDRFLNAALLSEMEFINIDKFYDNFEQRVREIFQNFYDVGYISGLDLNTCRIGEHGRQLYDSASSVSSFFLSGGVEKYKEEGIELSTFSLIGAPASVFQIKFEDSLLNFYELSSLGQLKEIFVDTFSATTD